MTKKERKLTEEVIDAICELSVVGYEDGGNSPDYYICPFCSAKSLSNNERHDPGFSGLDHDDDCLTILANKLQNEMNYES